MAEKQINLRFTTKDHKTVDTLKDKMRSENIPEQSISRTSAIIWAMEKVAYGGKK